MVFLEIFICLNYHLNKCIVYYVQESILQIY